MKRLTLYSRPECELCDRLLDELVPVLGERAEVEVVDISADPELERRYGLRIPVLSAEGRELSGYPLDMGRVRSILFGSEADYS